MGRKINYTWVVLVIMLLLHLGIFYAVLGYRMARLHLSWAQIQANLRMHVSVLTYGALFNILLSALLLTYFVYIKRYQWVNGIFIAIVIVALLAWMLKLYVVNYY